MERVNLIVSVVVISVFFIFIGCAAAPVSVLKDRGIKVALEIKSVDFYEKLVCEQGKCSPVGIRSDKLATKTKEAFREKFENQLKANGVEIMDNAPYILVVKLIYTVKPAEETLMQEEYRLLQSQVLLYDKNTERPERPIFVGMKGAFSRVLQDIPGEASTDMEIGARQRHARLLASHLGNDLANFFANKK